MKTIFIDFEMNPIQSKFKEARRICKNEIIEIGAVLLDDSFMEIATFKQYVKPEFNEIADRYVRVTGSPINTCRTHYVLKMLFWSSYVGVRINVWTMCLPSMHGATMI